jgi:DNA-binding PadR family transcriptional regulator
MSPVFRHGRLRLYLLRLLDEEPRHGYDIIRLLRDRFMGVYAPSPGTIYPRLARLEEEGLVTHDEENGRKVYRITEAGRAELRNRGDELDELEEELSASVSDIVREVREDVRETVRSLREELTWAAREMRRTEREAQPEDREAAREQARQAREAAWARSRQVREQAEQVRQQARQAGGQARQAGEQARDQARQAKEQAKDQARQAREHARQAREEALSHAQWLREEATHLRDDARERFRSVFQYATGEREQGPRAGEPREGKDHGRESREGGPRAESRESSGHDWGGWHGWGEWARWTDWPGRKSWPGPRDMAAFHDMERLAKEFATDLRKVAWDSGALGGDVMTSLRDILEDTLDRIRTEIFGLHDEPAKNGAPADAAPAKDSPAESTSAAAAETPAGDAATPGADSPAGNAAGTDETSGENSSAASPGNSATPDA